MDEGAQSSTQVLVGGSNVTGCESAAMPGDTGGGVATGAGGFGFGDDLMLDFGGGGVGPGRRDGDGTYDEFAMMGDLQNLPWYAWTEGGSSAS